MQLWHHPHGARVAERRKGGWVNAKIETDLGRSRVQQLRSRTESWEMIVLTLGAALLGLCGPQFPPRGAGRARPIIFSAAPAPALPRISLADGRPANRGLSSEHRARLNTLLRQMSERSDGAEAAALVWDAFRFSYRYHYKQRRASGEPYITHPLEVASILADLAIDVPSVLTGLLHDTVEDTGATLDDIEGRYGGEVARLVNAVTKLDRLELRQAILNGNGNGLGGGGGGGKSASEAARPGAARPESWKRTGRAFAFAEGTR